MNLTFLVGTFFAGCVLQGCASWEADALPVSTSAKAVPAGREVLVGSAPIGQSTFARYGGDVTAQAGRAMVRPVISLMPLAPAHYGAPSMVRQQVMYGFYPPPPPHGQAAPQPRATLPGSGVSGNPCPNSAGAALAGAVIGGVLGHQAGDGSGRSAATVLGVALGALAATQANAARDNCR